jgi:hypothetical protein
LTTEPVPGDQTSPYQRKVFALTKTLVGKIEPAVLPGSLPLHHDGNGLYSVVFPDTSKPGLYRFLLTYDFEAPDGSGRIRRIEQIEREVKIRPDPAATSVSSRRGEASGEWFVTVTPRDRFGNYLGPGAAPRVQIKLVGPGTVAGVLDDPLQKGDYVLHLLDVPLGEAPKVSVFVDEIKVPVDLHPFGPGPSPGSTPRFRLFLDAGPNFPHGDLNLIADGRLSVNAGLEGFVAPSTSIEGIVGYHSFKSPFISDPHIWQLSLNVKQYFGPGPLHFFLNAGAGAYRFDPGSTTKLGGNAGAGVSLDLSSLWSLEALYNFHTINSSGTNTQFSTVQVGIRHTL